MSESYHWPDEAFIFWWFASKAISNKAHFGHHSLPGFLLPLASADHLQDLCLTLSTHFGKRDLPFALQTSHKCCLKHMTSYKNAILEIKHLTLLKSL